MKFLTSMAPSWNISMFHYRNQGADYSRVLVGLQMPSQRTARVQPISGSVWLSATGTKPRILRIGCSLPDVYRSRGADCLDLHQQVGTAYVGVQVKHFVSVKSVPDQNLAHRRLIVRVAHVDLQ